MEPTQLLDVLRDTVANYRDVAAQKNIALDMKVDEELPLVCASAKRMAQVFDNLISNGVKYTPDGGTVTVDARIEDGSIVISVADTGIGMSEEEMQHLFEDFYRAPRVKATHEGTGLGLSVVQRIVQAHHGTVRAQSAVDQGTRFDVSIPICGLTLPPPSS
jgi:signal transduction histidine kinase